MIDDFKQRLQKPFDANILREREKQQEYEVLRRFADTPDVTTAAAPMVRETAPRLDSTPKSRFGSRFEGQAPAVATYAYDAAPAGNTGAYARAPPSEYPPRDDQFDRSGYRAGVPPSRYGAPPATAPAAGYAGAMHSQPPAYGNIGHYPAYSEPHAHSVPPAAGNMYPDQYRYDAAPRSTRFGERSVSQYMNAPPSRDHAYAKHPHSAPGVAEHGSSTWNDVMSDANVQAPGMHSHAINDAIITGAVRHPVHNNAPGYSDI